MLPVSSSESVHSRYDPIKEAERFADLHRFSFTPVFIVITEPGKSYLASSFRFRYPETKLVCNRNDDQTFLSSDNLWDFVWRAKNGVPLSSFLFDLLPDEYLPLTVFIAWKPSDRLWPAQAQFVWETLAEMIRIQTSVMYTREHFGKRWLTNMIKNAVLLQTILSPKFAEKPVFLAAAGPGLESRLPFNRTDFHVFSVSSALTCMQTHNCQIDLCFATDGGYWALEHFRTIKATVPVAFPLEAAIPSSVLESNPTVMLSYGSELEKEILQMTGIVPERAQRNGSVSGTVAQFALDCTHEPVYAAGLDLMSSASFSHARPHASDVPNEVMTDRFHPLAGILYARNRETTSLEMYASWFSSRGASFKKRFFRLEPAKKVLPGISTVTLPESNHSSPGMSQKTETGFQTIPDFQTRKKMMIVWLENLESIFSPYSDTDYFHKNYLPFLNEILQNPRNLEIFQMTAYSDYIRLLKQSKSPDFRESLCETGSGLCRKTIAHLDKLIRMVSSYG
jgi:hypothetical protein